MFIPHVRFVRLNIESILAVLGFIKRTEYFESLTKSCRGKLVSLDLYSHVLFSNGRLKISTINVLL